MFPILHCSVITLQNPWWSCQALIKTWLCFKCHSNSITCNTQYQGLRSILVSFMLLNNVSATSVLVLSSQHTVTLYSVLSVSEWLSLNWYKRLRLSIRLSPILIFSFLINLLQQLFDMWMGEITTDELILTIKP